MQLGQLKTQALRYVALGDYAKALRVYQAIVEVLPTDIDARMRIGDVLVQCQRRDLAVRAYAGVALCDLQGGRPLHAMVAIRALADLGHDPSELRLGLAQLYGKGSPRIGKGGRLSPPSDDTELPPFDPSLEVSLETAASSAALIAAHTASIATWPPLFPPVPLLSELPPDAFARLLAAATVRRLGHGALVVREGDPGDAFYFLASGALRVHRSDGKGGRQELARLAEGALFGEMALVSARPRTATVEVVGAADVVELGRASLHAAASELSTVATALGQFTRERMVKNLLATSPLFQLFDDEQRLELARHMTVRDLAAEDEVQRQGEPPTALHIVLSGMLGVVEGEAPFDRRIATLGPGLAAGAAELLDGRPAEHTVKALGPSVVVALPRIFVERLVRAVPDLRALLVDASQTRTETLASDDEAVELDDEDLVV